MTIPDEMDNAVATASLDQRASFPTGCIVDWILACPLGFSKSTSRATDSHPAAGRLLVRRGSQTHFAATTAFLLITVKPHRLACENVSNTLASNRVAEKNNSEREVLELHALIVSHLVFGLPLVI